MLMARLPIAVVMRRRTLRHPWADAAWSAVAVMRDPGGLRQLMPLAGADDEQTYLVSGVHLDLYPDEDEGYYENWAAPEPKVFVLWRMQGENALPVAASVSYAEGTRMLDSGECADGVPMPGDIHAWLAEYLQAHYRPRPRGGRQHG